MSWRERGALRIDAEITAKDKQLVISAAELTRLRERLRGTKPSKTTKELLKRGASVQPGSSDRDDAMYGQLNLIVGCDVMVLRNTQTQSGIVNGTIATVVDIVLHNESSVRFERLPTQMGGGIHFVSASNVKGLVLKYTDPDWVQRQLFTDLPPGCFPLVLSRYHQSYSDYVNQKPQKLSFLQFACAPAFAVTGHKVQGATLRRVLLCGMSGKAGYLYVVLSRVRSLQTLFLTQPIPLSLDFYTPRDDISIEVDRLRRLVFRPTLNRLRQMADPGGFDIEFDEPPRTVSAAASADDTLRSAVVAAAVAASNRTAARKRKASTHSKRAAIGTRPRLGHASGTAAASAVSRNLRARSAATHSLLPFDRMTQRMTDTSHESMPAVAASVSVPGARTAPSQLGALDSKHSDSTNSYRPARSASPASGVPNTTQWLCEFCRFANSRELSLCVSCLRNRPVPAGGVRAPVGWAQYS